MSAPCSTCEHVHCAGEVVAVGKFQPSGPSGYRHANSARMFPTRAEAEADLCAARSCRCQIVGSSRDPYEPHIPSQPEWEQADDCPVHPLSREQRVEAAEDRAEQAAYDAARERS